MWCVVKLVGFEEFVWPNFHFPLKPWTGCQKLLQSICWLCRSWERYKRSTSFWCHPWCKLLAKSLNSLLYMSVFRFSLACKSYAESGFACQCRVTLHGHAAEQKMKRRGIPSPCMAHILTLAHQDTSWAVLASLQSWNRLHWGESILSAGGAETRPMKDIALRQMVSQSHIWIIRVVYQNMDSIANNFIWNTCITWHLHKLWYKDSDLSANAP